MADRFVLLADSASDITDELAAELDIELIQLTVSVDGGEAVPGNKLNFKEFYSQMRDGKEVKTSAVNLDELTRKMDSCLADGRDVLYIAFSSGLSSTASTGKIAAEELSEKYPARKIYVVDSLSASLGYGLLVYHAANLRIGGAAIEEVRDFAENTKLHLCHWFTVDDLYHLKRGGRVSAATALVGTMLSIKPVLHVDNDGHLINVSKARGRKNAIQAMVDRMAKTVTEPETQMVFISHGDAEEEAEYLAQLVREQLHPKDIKIGYIGPVIGAHSGPGTLALFFLGSER